MEIKFSYNVWEAQVNTISLSFFSEFQSFLWISIFFIDFNGTLIQQALFYS